MFQPSSLPAGVVIGLVAVDIVTTGIAVVSYATLQRSSSAVRAIDQEYLPAMHELRLLQHAISETRMLARGVFMHVMAGEDARAEETKHRLLRRSADVRNHITTYGHLISTAEERVAWDRFSGAWESWHPLIPRFVHNLEAGMTAEAYSVAFDSALPHLETMDEALRCCIDLNVGYAHAADDRAESGRRLADVVVGLGALASVGLAIGVALTARGGLPPLDSFLDSVAGLF